MKIGFIGTGKIASSVITGICNSTIFYNKIVISPRNKIVAKNLKKKFKNIIIAKNNQEIVDNCSWVFLFLTHCKKYQTYLYRNAVLYLQQSLPRKNLLHIFSMPLTQWQIL